ncbi:l-ascorbate oxidase-like [Lichtheimia corymbifera JMRC:FSU:9682]|uniref:L-ascorbate oxidase-like n=1 Tax=Lichtheimia corymbifera JMRC:FSU:9682 TaxID=1263082 RepID=A0A068SDG5_9FUNG|nr:l-ascorbate oxidase-like [Lichtheimia corymbifera JMRC:FSU:9682]
MVLPAVMARRGSSSDDPVEFELNVTQEQINPDCSDYNGNAVLVNQQLPGPAITVTQGDYVRITVRNFLPALSHPVSNVSGAGLNDVTIHFHGIRQYGSVDADGVPFLTQHPIPPGAEYVHQFRVINQAGTYFYHAHVGLQEQTVFGPFIIHEANGPSEKYDDERIISLSEWWHVSRASLEEYFLGPQFEFIPEAQSVLINGRTVHSIGNPSSPSCEGYSIINVERGRTYRLRVIGASTFRTLGFGIAHHNLTIIEVDGEPIKPYSVPFLEVAPGQRFSVLLHTTQPLNDYTIGTNRRWAEDVSRGSNGMAILRYHKREPRRRRSSISKRQVQTQGKGAVVTRLPHNQPHFPVAETPQWVWSNLEPLHGVDPVVYRPASRTVKLRATDQKMPDGSTRWFINDVSFVEPSTPILMDLAKHTRRPPSIFTPTAAKTSNGYDPYLGTYPLQYFEIVDFVLQSTHIPGEPCRSHPWHTHGHSHWEIAYGTGEYDEARDGSIRNIPNPLQKDVTLVYPRSDPAEDIHGNGTLATDQVGCGWSKIRILAVRCRSDNPGIWAMHCHNAPHMLMGMMLILEEAPDLISIPSSMRPK